jgi:site-specific recombinase XerD
VGNRQSQSHLAKKREKQNLNELLSNRIFCRINGEPIKRFDSAWRSVCKSANITDLHFHDLRHTFCSNLLLAGGDLKSVKDMIGHKDLSMTDRYSHLTAEYKRSLQGKLASHYTQPAQIQAG